MIKKDIQPREVLEHITDNNKEMFNCLCDDSVPHRAPRDREIEEIAVI